MSTVWNPENIRDVAESVGVAAVGDEVVGALSSDVEYRLSQVIEEALKFMRHARRSALSTQDVAQALRVLDVEPLYGYESTRPLRFGEASIGPGQPLFYVEDEEVDFEKLINAPLPKVPREVSFTAHWLAVEGVQPSIPQNPAGAGAADAGTASAQRGGGAGGQELLLLPKGQAAVMGGTLPVDAVAAKPLVRHVLSKELQLYFERVCAALLDEGNDEYRLAALASLRSDPGLHQLLPYFVQFVAEKVTHELGKLFVLHQMLALVSALLDNPSLHIAPYVGPLVPPILTCLVSPRIGPPPGSTGFAGASSNPAGGAGATSAPNPDSAAAGSGAAEPTGANAAASPPTLPDPTNPLEPYPLRATAASLLGLLTQRHAPSFRTLRPRLARTCLKHWLDPKKPLPSHYGALLGLAAVSGEQGARVLVAPNLKEYAASVLGPAFARGGQEGRDAEMVVGAVLGALEKMVGEEDGKREDLASAEVMEGWMERVEDKVGPLIAERVIRTRKESLAKAVAEVLV